MHRRWLKSLAADVAALRRRGQQVLIVSSGAIAVGRRHLGLPEGHIRLHEQQAAAATGMIRLAHAYQDVLAAHDLSVAQVLLTLDDTENRRRYINARNTLETLLKLGAVPLINENDTVATDEIRVGDNDRLAARVAAMVSADLLILLSDIDGLYSADPRDNPDAEPIPVVEHEITPAIEAMAGVAASADSRGGMVTKLAAAQIAMRAGARMIIAHGGHQAYRGRRPRHLVRAARQSTHGAQGMDCRVAETERRLHRRCWRRESAGRRQEPAAGRSRQRRRPVPAWRGRRRENR